MGVDRLCQGRRIVGRPGDADFRPAIDGADRIAGERATEIGRQPDPVADLVADAVAPGQAAADAVLAPGEEMAGNPTAVAEIALIEEAAVTHRVLARLPAPPQV